MREPSPNIPSLVNIGAALDRIADRIEQTIAGAAVHKAAARDSRPATRLFVRDVAARIVTEPNLVIRGAVFPPERRDLVEAREVLIEAIRVGLTASERAFLRSTKAAEPRWALMDLLGIETLPGEAGQHREDEPGQAASGP